MARVKLRSTEEREAAGKALRKKCPRALHGKVILGQGADRDIVKLIKASNHDRLENLVPIRHGRMAQSPFTFYRGTAALQAYDLAGTPASGIIAQACGDCHLMNFGGFATPERTLAFDINDFDETLPAPFEWDLKRLAASFVVAARWRGFDADTAREAVLQVVASYRESMKERSGTGTLEAWYSQITAKDVQRLAEEMGGEAVNERTKASIEKAHKQTHERVFQKLTIPSEGGLPRIADQPPLIYHVDKKDLDEEMIRKFFKRYRDTLSEERRMLFDRYQTIDIALKVVGVGSVGTRCFIALLMASPDDPLFLQVKEARRSVLEPYVKGAAPAHNGQRIVVGQRLMQSASDIFLGWSKGEKGRDFYVRQLRDMKMAPQVEIMEPETLVGYANLCGLVLARAHDKAGDAAVIAGYLGSKDTFGEAMADYAVGYADQVEGDYETFVKAIRSGKLSSDTMPGAVETAIR